MIIRALILVLILHSTALARTTLTGNDFTYLGAFAMPRLIGGIEAESAYGVGLALRRVNGEVRLFSTARKVVGEDTSLYLYEVSVPALVQNPPSWNEASVVKYWGDVFSDEWWLPMGLYWDETDARLYYTSSSIYEASGDPYAPTLSYLTIDTGETGMTSHGRWGYSNRSFKQVNYGITAVPSDFAMQYLNGKRLAAGFGGVQSVYEFGPISYGPSMTAFSPPTTEQEGTYLPNTPLVGYGGASYWTSGDRPAVNRCWRPDTIIPDIYAHMDDADESTANANPTWHLTGDENFYWQGYSIDEHSREYLPDYITFQPSDIVTKHWVPGEAFWATDYIHQGGVWIQTTNKEGVVILPTFAKGHIYYRNSNPIADGLQHEWLIYSRDQIASVVQGTVGEDDIQPTRYSTNFADLNIPSDDFAFGGNPPYMATGMAFDPVDNKLYVAIQYGSNAPTLTMYSTHLIVVYQINDNINSGASMTGTGQIPLSGSGTMTLQ